MLVKQVMNKKVVVAKPEITIKEASRFMSKFHIGSLVVVDKTGIAGIITERDVLNSVAEGKDTDQTQVIDVMSRNVITIEPNKTVEEAVDLMVEHKIKKLPAVREGKLIGIITASDIIVVEPKLIQNIANLISMKLPGYRGG